ncbi:MAG: hypothetical protein J0H74_31045 [Chitinophagaceae bacterium]|nr:hypothetical protein [Chitinophagaceae bacterium]
MKSVFKWTAFLLGVVYLANCGSPLRLHTDMLRYFAIKDCIELGCPPDSTAAKDYLPYGYTALLLVLSKAGLLKSWCIVLLNCIYLGGSLYFVVKLFRATTLPVYFFLTLVLLNWTTVKFAAHPLSEMQYMFFSIGSLYLFQLYTEQKRFLLLAGAIISGAIAFITRSVGVVLAVTLVAGFLWQYRKALLALISKNRVVVGIAVLVFIGVVVFSRQLGLNHYGGVFSKQFKEGLTVATMFRWHFTEWAEMGINISALKVEGYYPRAGILFLIAGILFFAGLIYLLLFRKNQVPFIVKVYLLFYSILMFNWPFYDPRFWVPVLPLVLAVILQYPLPRPGWRRGVTVVAFAGYMLLGVLAVGFFTYTSLNKKVFVRTQANGVFRNEYETFFYGKPTQDTARVIDPVILSVITRYDR